MQEGNASKRNILKKLDSLRRRCYIGEVALSGLRKELYTNIAYYCERIKKRFFHKVRKNPRTILPKTAKESKNDSSFNEP